MPYIHFTEEQKLRANSVDLAEFLRRQGEKLIPSGRDKRLASDHSITVRGNEWYDHESKEGGKAISFVQTFYGLSYPEAVKRLLDGEGIAYAQAQPEPEEEKQFALPPANQTMRRTYAYLLQERLISRDILSSFAHKKLIYESRELSKDKMKEYATPCSLDSTSTALPVMLTSGAYIPRARAIGAMWLAAIHGIVFTGQEPVISSMCLKPLLTC